MLEKCRKQSLWSWNHSTQASPWEGQSHPVFSTAAPCHLWSGRVCTAGTLPCPSGSGKPDPSWTDSQTAGNLWSPKTTGNLQREGVYLQHQIKGFPSQEAVYTDLNDEGCRSHLLCCLLGILQLFGPLKHTKVATFTLRETVQNPGLKWRCAVC